MSEPITAAGARDARRAIERGKLDDPQHRQQKLEERTQKCANGDEYSCGVVDALITDSPSSWGKYILITRRMADAINDYAGKQVIEDQDVEQQFFIGVKGDTEIGIDVGSNHNVGGSNFRKFLGHDGQLSKMCFRMPRSVTTSGGYTMLIEAGSFPRHFCSGVMREWESIDPTKATVIIGALFGFAEAAHTPTELEKGQAVALRTAMSPDN